MECLPPKRDGRDCGAILPVALSECLRSTLPENPRLRGRLHVKTHAEPDDAEIGRLRSRMAVRTGMSAVKLYIE